MIRTLYFVIIPDDTDKSRGFHSMEFAEAYLAQRFERYVLDDVWSDDEDSLIHAIPGIAPNGDARVIWPSQKPMLDLAGDIPAIWNEQYGDPIQEIQRRVFKQSLGWIERRNVEI